MDRATPAVLAVLAAAYAGISFLAYTDRGTRPSEPSTEARQGRRVWLSHNCSACHQVYGLGGFLGPDLTNVWSRRGPAHVRRVLRDGWQDMPKLNLREDEVESLERYFEYLDSTGEFPPRGEPPRGLYN